MPIPVKKTKEEPKTARERIYNELKQWIIDGTMQPGERINDQEIANYFSVSRSPVREAMQMLVNQNLIEVKPGKMSCVTKIDPANTMSAYKIAAEIHSLALEYAYPKIDADTIRELNAYNMKFRQAYEKGDVKEIYKYDGEFHNVFIRLAQNPFLKEFSNILLSHTLRIEYVYFKDIKYSKKSYDQHLAIIQALKDHDLEKAKEAMRENWLHTLRIFENNQQMIHTIE